MAIWFQPVDVNALNNRNGQGLNQHIGMVFTEIGDDYLRSRTPLTKHTQQPLGLWHGGASCVVAEAMGSVGCMLCLDPSYQACVGVDINATHMRAVSAGDVHAEARPLKMGRTMHTWETRLWNDADKLICIARLTTSVIDRA